MYSRKSIRAYQPMTRYLPAEGEGEQSKVTPPPDYTGMAFYERSEPVDYPETVIEPMEETVDPVEEIIEPPVEEISEPEPMREPAIRELSPEFPQEQLPSAENEAPPTSVFAQEQPPRPSPDPIEGVGEASLPPLLTPSWLRSLTLEDMLLFWLILLLLSGEPEDQIYLLLGLLLLTGR